MMIFAAMIGVLILAGGLLLLIQARKKRLSERQKKTVREQWKQIEGRSGTEPSRALMDADSLLSWALGCLGYQGTMAEKLKKSKGLFSDLDEVWHAHKMRNQMAHEPGFECSEAKLKASLAAFRRALKDIGI